MRDYDFIQPGTYVSSSTSPLKMIPRKPGTAQKLSSGPDLSIIGQDGKPLDHLHFKKKLINPWQFYTEINELESDSADDS